MGEGYHRGFGLRSSAASTYRVRPVWEMKKNTSPTPPMLTACASWGLRGCSRTLKWKNLRSASLATAAMCPIRRRIPVGLGPVIYGAFDAASGRSSRAVTSALIALSKSFRGNVLMSSENSTARPSAHGSQQRASRSLKSGNRSHRFLQSD